MNTASSRRQRSLNLSQRWTRVTSTHRLGQHMGLVWSSWVWFSVPKMTR